MCTLLYYTGPMHTNACLQLDNEGMGWLSPYSSTLQQFLTQEGGEIKSKRGGTNVVV